MNVKKIITLLSIIIISTSVFGEEKLSKVSNYENRNDIYFFNGYDFQEIESSAHSISLTDFVDSEIRDISERQTKRTGKNKEYTIIGYSEGGLRVLAYAKRLKEKMPNEYKNLKAVITVSGIDKGIKALDGGFTPLKSKVQNDINTIYNGVNGFIIGMPLTSLVALVIGDIALCANKNTILELIADVTPWLDSYITCAWKGGTYDQLAELYDMMPGSNFIKNNVAYVQSVPYKVQVDTRNEISLESKKILGIRIYYPVIKKIPVYKNYTAYKDVMQIDSNLPVGYIVGTDSNTLGFLNDAEDIDINESDVRTGAAIIKGAMYTAAAVNIAKCVASLGILSYHATAASNCISAGDWFKNIDSEINELKGSNENDGLVAKESQYYPKTFYNPDTKRNEEVHSKVLSKTMLGYETMYYNHMTINPNNNDETKDTIFKMIDYADSLKKEASLIIQDNAK